MHTVKAHELRGWCVNKANSSMGWAFPPHLWLLHLRLEEKVAVRGVQDKESPEDDEGNRVAAPAEDLPGEAVLLAGQDVDVVNKGT